MKKRNMWIAAAVISMMMTGCGTKAEVEPATFEDTEAVETTVAVTEEETTVAETEAADYLPTTYEVFTDDQPHYLMYAADEEHTYFNTFISVSRPDMGIASMPFIADFVKPENGEVRKIENDKVTLNTDEDVHATYDMTNVSWTADPEGFQRWIPSDGEVALICTDFEMAGDTPTLEEMTKLAEQYNIVVYDDEVYTEILQDGTKFFVVITAMRPDENDPTYYTGGMGIRVKDGKAQGAYVLIRNEELKDSLNYVRYMVHSIRFVD